MPPPALSVHRMKDSRSSSLLQLWGIPIGLLFASLSIQAADLRVEPTTISLTQSRYPHSLLVSTTTPDGLSQDITGSATFTSADEKIATVDAFGWVRPVASGKTTISIKASGSSLA